MKSEKTCSISAAEYQKKLREDAQFMLFTSWRSEFRPEKLAELPDAISSFLNSLNRQPIEYVVTYGQESIGPFIVEARTALFAGFSITTPLEVHQKKVAQFPGLERPSYVPHSFDEKVEVQALVRPERGWDKMTITGSILPGGTIEVYETKEWPDHLQWRLASPWPLKEWRLT